MTLAKSGLFPFAMSAFSSPLVWPWLSTLFPWDCLAWIPLTVPLLTVKNLGRRAWMAARPEQAAAYASVFPTLSTGPGTDQCPVKGYELKT